MPLLTCPNCNTGMQEVHRNNVAFDSCPQCRGVWLDRGELEKILSAGREYEGYQDRGKDSHYRSSPKPYYSKKKHWIFDIFD